MKIKQIISPFGHLISQKALVKWTGRKMIFPFYHAVSDQKLPYISNLYPLRSIQDFQNDLDYLCQHFTPIGIDEVHSRIQSKRDNNPPAFHLSFDDGLKEVYEIIAPILEAKGIPATFFINTDFIDNKKLFYRYKIGLILEQIKMLDANEKTQTIKNLLQDNSKWVNDIHSSMMKLNYHDQKLIADVAQILELNFEDWLTIHKPYLTTVQLLDLLKRGFRIGSHSIDHPRFKNINFEDQRRQFESSFEFLKASFGVEERLFSFPFGDDSVKAEFFDWMYNQGKCKLSFGVSGIKDDYSKFHMHRIPMDECQTNPQSFIKSEYIYFMMKSIFNKNKIQRN